MEGLQRLVEDGVYQFLPDLQDPVARLEAGLREVLRCFLPATLDVGSSALLGLGLHLVVGLLPDLPRFVLRLAVGCFRTHLDDIDGALDVLRRQAEDLAQT